jgi:hypothetical protein
MNDIGLAHCCQVLSLFAGQSDLKEKKGKNVIFCKQSYKNRIISTLHVHDIHI